MLTHSNGKGSGSGMNDGILCYSHPERRLRTERESVEEWTTILELSHFGRNYWRSSFSIGPACAPRPGMSAFRVGLAPRGKGRHANLPGWHVCLSHGEIGRAHV